jgi:beta-phosphoglucomutase-like phosphatase (HAD superfamily)
MVRSVASAESPSGVAALGFSVHTGWAALVAVSRSASGPTVLDRRRVDLLPIPPRPGQDTYPYVFHAARELSLEEAERFVRKAEAEARATAQEALRAMVETLGTASHRVVMSAIITAREGPRRSLEEILQSHTLVHAAEGAMFRAAIRGGSQDLGLGVFQVPAPELVQRAARALGLDKDEVPGFLTKVGRPLGPPWTADHKAATLAALLALS